MKLKTKLQKTFFHKYRTFGDFTKVFLSIAGSNTTLTIDNPIATIPPSLSGIDFKIV
jgi:hypothetical protein